MEKSPVVKYDEHGVMDGGTMGLPREMNRDIWLKEVFPEWGSYLNYEIDQFKVKPGAGALWYFGAMSCCIKEPGRCGLSDRQLRRAQHFHRPFLLRGLPHLRCGQAVLDAHSSHGHRPVEIQATSMPSASPTTIRTTWISTPSARLCRRPTANSSHRRKPPGE